MLVSLKLTNILYEVELRMKEKEKYEVIKELVDHNGNKNRASQKLGLSRRQIDRLIIKYKERGKEGFIPEFDSCKKKIFAKS